MSIRDGLTVASKIPRSTLVMSIAEKFCTAAVAQVIAPQIVMLNTSQYDAGIF
jgi:hypothetical protein